MSKYSRRQFLENSSKIAAGIGLASMPAAYSTAKPFVSANDKIRVGLIGCKGMGWSNLSSFHKIPEVDLVALCDVDSNVLNDRAGQFETMTGKKPHLYKDFRKLLENKDIDAVIIATPDHWHCLPTVQACEAGKDVYVEKPLANTIQECQIMVAAGRKYNRVVQVGQWQRSGSHWQDAVNFVQSGKLGNIRTVIAWAYMDWMPESPVKPDQPAPPGVDYDMWLGPAPKRPFNPNRFHFNFRWYWDYAGGLMTDWGVHLIDMAFYAMKAQAPKSVMSSGGKFAYPNDAMETPDTQVAIYEFDNFTMVWEHAVGIGLGPFQRAHGVAFIGNNGTLVVDRSKWEIFPEIKREDQQASYKMEAIPVHSGGRGDLDNHTQNFIECMKTREKPNCDVAIASNTAINAHMGNIAYKVGRKVYWDQNNNSFQNDKQANELITANYRDPWKLPKIT